MATLMYENDLLKKMYFYLILSLKQALKKNYLSLTEMKLTLKYAENFLGKVLRLSC
jgi:hypothetical protein